MKYLLAGLMSVLLPCLLNAQEMIPDRPDQTEEVHVVPRGRFQLESGLIINGFDSGRSAVINRSILRYGLSKRVEIGLLTEQGRDRNRYLDETVQSSYPVALRLKAVLLQKHSWLPDITLVGYGQIPVAKNDEGQKAKPSGSVLVAFLNEIGKKWKLDYTAGFQQEAFGPKFGWQVFTSLHYEISEKTECFAGSYSQFQRDEHPFHNLNVGIAYYLLETLQVDIAAGHSINREDGNGFVTVGFAWLL
ncbi:MAG: transporter [Flavitalea sp.]